MKLKSTIFVLLLFLLMNVKADCAQLRFDSVMNNYQDYITDIYTCGNWKYKNQEGFYRIIYIEYLYGCSWVYVQWMKGFAVAPQGTTKVLKTIPIYHNDHHENTFGKPRCIETSLGIKLKYIAENGHTMSKNLIEIDVFHQIGKYDLKVKPE